MIFNVSGLDERDRTKLIRLISNIISGYLPSLVMIQLKPSAAERPGFALFQSNLLLAYNEIDSELAGAALINFYDHAHQWVTPVPPYCVEAIQTGHFSDSVDARKLLQERRARLKDISKLGSKAAACILFFEVAYLKHTGEYRQQQSSCGKIF